MHPGTFAHRLAACPAVLSLLGWLELPSEHVHARSDDDHRVEYVHRHVELHLPVHHDHAVVDHEDDATYLAGAAVTFTRVPSLIPLLTVLPIVLGIAPERLSAGWVNGAHVVRVHAPPWRNLYTRRGPPAFAV